jgi:hypothetical protein
MRLHTSRVLVFVLFVIWIGGMLYFFTSGQNPQEPLSHEERSRLVKIGKLARENDHNGHDRHRNNADFIDHRDQNKKNIAIPKDPKQRGRVLDADLGRRLQDFDWKDYVKRGALKPGEDKNQRNAYNQEASEKLTWDRAIPDVRDAQ